MVNNSIAEKTSDYPAFHTTGDRHDLAGHMSGESIRRQHDHLGRHILRGRKFLERHRRSRPLDAIRIDSGRQSFRGGRPSGSYGIHPDSRSEVGHLILH